MTEEKWLDLIETLKSKFKLTQEAEEQITSDDMGNEIINQIERITFNNELGEFKLEWITRPVILDKKVHYSHTSGTKGLVEYVLSPTEKTSKVYLYKKNDNEWQELDMSSGGLKF